MLQHTNYKLSQLGLCKFMKVSINPPTSKHILIFLITFYLIIIIPVQHVKTWICDVMTICCRWMRWSGWRHKK